MNYLVSGSWLLKKYVISSFSWNSFMSNQASVVEQGDLSLSICSRVVKFDFEVNQFPGVLILISTIAVQVYMPTQMLR